MRIKVSLQVEFDAVNGNVLDCAENAEMALRTAVEDVLWPDEDFVLTSDAEDIDDPAPVEKKTKRARLDKDKKAVPKTFLSAPANRRMRGATTHVDRETGKRTRLK